MSSGVSSISASFNSMARRSDSQKTSIATWIGHSFPSMRMSTEVTAVSSPCQPASADPRCFDDHQEIHGRAEGLYQVIN